MSSPKYPLGNSEAERAVQTVKRLLSKCDDPYEALMIYRGTPLPHNSLSPSQMLFGRQIKTPLPCAPQKLLPSHAISKNVRRRETRYRDYAKQNYDRARRVQVLPPLQKGDSVHVKGMNVEGRVVKEASRPRSFVVETPKSTIERNRRHLVKLQRRVNFDKEIDVPLEQNNQPAKTADCTVPVPIVSNDVDKHLSLSQTSANNQASDRSYITRSGRVSKMPDRL